MSQEDYIYRSDLDDIITSLKTIYENHSLVFPQEVDDSKDNIYITSKEIIAVYNAFQQAYENEKLSVAEKWVINNEELQRGGILKSITINNALVSLTSLEAINPCSRVEHTNVTTYTQTSHTATTTYSQTAYTNSTTNSRSSNTAGTTYSKTNCGRNCKQNSMRNASYSGNNQCSCHTVYSSDCSETSNTAKTTYSRSSYTAGTNYSNTSHTAGASYTQTNHTAGVSYTEEVI